MEELYAQTDTFYLGFDAFQLGRRELDCPSELSEALKPHWVAGLKSAERYAQTPRLSREQSDRISDEADRAYVECKRTGETPVNPYPADSEANAIWNCRMCDLPLIHGDILDDFEVLGTRVPITVLATHEDGSVLISIPAPVAD